jgi:hypothetical protein
MAASVNGVFENYFGGAPPATLGCNYQIRGPKTEIRKPKEARNPNSEKTGRPLWRCFRASDFGLPSAFGSRPSDFAITFELGSSLPPRLHFASN